MQRNYSALVKLALRHPTRQSMEMVQRLKKKAAVSIIICDTEHCVHRIQIRAMSLTAVRELHKKKRPSNKVLAAIEESKYNPVDSKSGKVSSWKTQRLVAFMIAANLVVLLVAQHIAPEEMKNVIEEEGSVVIGSYKFWSGASSEEKESKENTKQESKDGSKDYKSPLRDK